MIKIIENDLNITAKEITQILKEMGKSGNNAEVFCYPVRTSKKRKKMIQHSTFITARKTSYIRHAEGLNSLNQLIGLVRIIGDSTYEYYISEVMVIPSMQGKGIGTKLMNNTIAYCKKNGYMQIFLSSARGREKFYQKFGFEPCKMQVMKIKNPKLKK